MTRKRKWQYLDVSVNDIESMSRKKLIEFAENNGHIVNKKVKTQLIRDALIDWLIDRKADEIVDTYKTFEETEPTATKTPIERLPRKLDI